jgi:hypothetical protein
VKGKLKIKAASQESVSFTHFHVKEFRLSQRADNDGLYRIDVVGRRCGQTAGGDWVFERNEHSFTCLDGMAVVRQMLVSIDKAKPAEVESRLKAALGIADKGDSAACFASVLEFAGRLLLNAGKLDFDGTED